MFVFDPSLSEWSEDDLNGLGFDRHPWAADLPNLTRPLGH